MENPAPTAAVLRLKPSAPTLTRARVQKLIRNGSDTEQIARLLHTTEAQVYNVLAENET